MYLPRLTKTLFFVSASEGKSFHWANATLLFFQVTKGTDTAIRIFVTRTLQVYLYRILKNPKRYLYLDISPQSQTVTPNNLGDTALFQVRLGNTC